MFYTSYFANHKNFPEGAVCVSISQFPPKGYSGLEYKKVAPTRNILKEFKATGDTAQFNISYVGEVLHPLDPNDVVEEIMDLVGDYDADVIFLCFEKSGEHCHRHLFCKWLRGAGYECEELI